MPWNLRGRSLQFVARILILAGREELWLEFEEDGVPLSFTRVPLAFHPSNVTILRAPGGPQQPSTR